MARKKFTLLTIKQKAEILRKLSEGFSIDALAKSFHVHRSTINRIKNKKNTIRKFLAHAESGPGKRKTFKPAELPKMERALMKWFANQRAKNLPITSDMLKQKAKFLHAKIQEKSGDFHASNGWITNFKKRYGIRRLKICGEKLSNKTHSVNPFLQKPILESFEQNEDPCINCDLTDGEETNNVVVNTKKVTQEETISAYNICLEWADQNNASLDDIMTLQRLRSSVVLNNRACTKQTKISNFFSSP